MVFSNILLVFMIGLQFDTYQLMIDNTLRVFTGHIQLQAPGYLDEPGIRKTLPDIQALAEDVRANISGVDVSARATGFALASSEERSYGIQVVGVQPQYEAKVSTLAGLITAGRYLQQGDTNATVIGKILARNLKIGVGEELTILGSGRDGSMAADVLTVVGIFESNMPEMDRSLALMPLERFQNVFFMEGRGHTVVIRAGEFSLVDSKAAQLRQRYGAAANRVVLHWDELKPGLRQAIQADMASAWFMYAVLIVLVAFSVMNTQLMSVLERTREFGMIMALGLRPGRLVRLVLLETAVIASIGLLLGVLLGGGLNLVLSHTGFAYPGMEEMAQRFNLPNRIFPEVTLFTVLLGPGIVFAASMLASLYPALRVKFLQPIAAMKAV
ncbi:ABC transporter permease [Kineobactrum sediminis]|uniref:ABC transporter permease n=2 Tax=Kineobactrum sediminis TaxID=1905677 RepID=A0A2N5Y1B1_9GAMM|nr:ABC transporter permease [Kineobactrum sediminis]